MERDRDAMPRTSIRLGLILMLVAVTFTASFTARKKGKDNAAGLPEAIWRDPGNMASLNLLYGAGGKAHAPHANGVFTFVREDLEATSPKFDIQDDQGIRWRVKLGQEPESETAATRFLWAAGYFVDEDYYLATLKVRNMPTLHRGGRFVLLTERSTGHAWNAG